MKVDVSNLSFGYNELLFDNISFTIKPNKITTIIGKNGVGKTTLVKTLVGLNNYSGSIKYDDILFDNDSKNSIINDISILFSDYKNVIINKNIYDDILFELEKKEFDEDKYEEIINKVSSELGLEYLVHKNYDELSDSDLSLACLLIMLISSPKLLIIDNALNNLNYDKKIKIFEYLKKKKITVINISNNVEDILLSDSLIILNDKKCICSNNIKKILEKESIFNECNFKLPFIVDLSTKLKFYNLIDDIILDKEALVDSIWK